MSTNLIINTNLADGISEDILFGIIAQLSDGMWKDSPIMRHYWDFVEIKNIDNNICIVIDSTSGNYEGKRFFKNYFYTQLKLNPQAIAKWFATKLKQIVKSDAKQYPSSNIVFSNKCEQNLHFLSTYKESYRSIKANEAYRVYQALNNI